MARVRAGLLVAVVVLAVAAGPAWAAPTFGVGLNSAFFQNFENIYRPASACTETTCLPFDPLNDPAGFRRVRPPINPGDPPNLQVGDIFAGIFNVQNIDAGGVTVWTQILGVDQFSGYFAQQVVSLTNPGTHDPTSAFSHITLGPVTTDPFGILDTTTHEMIRGFVNDGPEPVTNFESNGTIFDDIAKATDGTLWASLGITDTDGPGPLTAGYAYTHANLGVGLSNFSGNALFLALNRIIDNTGLGLLAINDLNECEIGGNPAPCVNPVSTFNEIVGTGELERNPNSTLLGGTSPWIFRSNDPLELFRVPAPATLTLLGLALVGVAVGGRVRRRRLR